MNIDLTPYYAEPGEQPFGARRMAMPWRNSVPLSPEQIPAGWQTLKQQIVPARKRLLYLHIPFCATHCTFCGFYQNKLRDDSTATYTRYLLQELAMEADSPLHQSAPIHAVYFGGGTPTALAADELSQIIRAIRTSLPLAPDCEITVEGRAMDFDDERIDACLDAGANRFSIGIQTFDTRIRQRMARTSDKQQSIRFLERLCERDRAAVVCDLMFGLPEQTPEIWREDLAIVSDLPLDGVDLYALNLLPTTPLAKAAENQRVALPDVVARRDFYRTGAAFLADAGWHQLSNSHWARTTRERNLYNLLIKQGADCLAMGSGAGGNLNGQAYMMERSLERYYQQIDQGQKPIMMMTPASPTGPWQHQLQAGIEVGRIKLPQLTQHARELQPLLSQWHQAGLTCDDSTCLRLTNDGRFWANNLMQALQQIIPQLNAEEHAH
ncbi:heme anaerobic degradation radical SAM methyltransferase ChuW/HutW [Pectobacterium aquaticum]|uniref:Heme anaerobic degradation radical SAM methyltransferase ChuW/HutW n=1 Tax=Pectobacterium aquaticum TaxID=2204145 RepID=A0AA93DMT2_9GAMM|nr:heme anaerobic degradation radical SAM methyltransferase ChuW/HutW [Pectobacterium aquaticum]MDQ5892572.1 anaerobilin synthase [Pseudomonadota bacterium]RRO23830.1 heme anaerobic degradation radical SAM methyltransferase ChuW/HutW [Pectobacterium aquaticum]